MEIKPINHEHINRICELMDRNKHKYIGLDTREGALETLKQNLSIGAFVDHTLVGFILCYVPQTLDVFFYRKSETLINDLFIVDKEYQRQGISTSLLESFSQIAKENGMKQMIATVSPINIASVNSHLKSKYFIESLLYKKNAKYIPNLEHSYGRHAYYRNNELELAPGLSESISNISLPENYRYLMVKEVE